MRCEICGEGSWDDGLPDSSCWDARATPDQVHEWVRRIQHAPDDPARRFLGSIGSPRAAEALRSHLNSDDARILELVVASLGWSGDVSDGPALLALLEHDDPRVRLRAMNSLAELEVPAAVGPLASRLESPTLDLSERARLIECLAWLRYPGIVPRLREILQQGGPAARVDRRSVAMWLARVGGPEDRAEMARLAVARLERSAAEGFVEARYLRVGAWLEYEHNVGAVAPDEVAATLAAMSDDARKALTWFPYLPEADDEIAAQLGPLTRPRRSIAEFTAVRPPEGPNPPSKFFGQPDWRQRPAWPIGGDERPLMFFGQLALPDDRTAYLFVGGPEEWDPLGPGSALVVQPGGDCHLPTIEQREGPRSHHIVVEDDRFVVRGRRLPQAERFVVWADGLDPEEYPPGMAVTPHQWNKVGGTPAWLQGDDTPGPEWSYAFQFNADRAGSERGDGAVFYGWINDSGEGALGWQCH